MGVDPSQGWARQGLLATSGPWPEAIALLLAQLDASCLADLPSNVPSGSIKTQ